MNQITIFCDGSCEPVNPGGYACCGFVAYEGDVSGRRGATRPDPIFDKYGCIGNGPGMTNNIAEYRAVIAALKWAKKNFADRRLEFRTDSQLVVRQVNGQWDCNKEHLIVLRDQAREILFSFEDAKLIWIPRDENDVADYLTRVAYDEARRVEV
jgi:ribonuclease HI